MDGRGSDGGMERLRDRGTKGLSDEETGTRNLKPETRNKEHETLR